MPKNKTNLKKVKELYAAAAKSAALEILKDLIAEDLLVVNGPRVPVELDLFVDYKDVAAVDALAARLDGYATSKRNIEELDGVRGSGYTTREIMGQVQAQVVGQFASMLDGQVARKTCTKKNAELALVAFRDGMSALLMHLKNMGIVTVQESTPAESETAKET